MGIEDFLPHEEKVLSTPDSEPRKRKPLSEEAKQNIREGQRKRRAGSSMSSRDIRTKLEQLFNTLGGIVTMKNQIDGYIIMANASNLAEAYSELADNNNKVKQVFEGLTKGGVYGAAIMATAAVALPILANHALVPAVLGNMFAPEGLPTDEAKQS